MSFPHLQSEVYFPDSLIESLEELLQGYPEDKVFVVTENNTERLCWPLLASNSVLNKLPRLVIGTGEESKSTDTLIQVWQFLSDNGADRKSLVINVGGGMLTDLCGFAASTYKRGMHFVNIPTTLLSQVDASVGGKTGINFNGFKNEVGTFALPQKVYINTEFLKTIGEENNKSGFAEMVKHGLIWDANHFEDLKKFDLDKMNLNELKDLIARSVVIKEHFVLNDPTEKGIRKALNFGHTAGHAFESYAMKKQKPMLHGYAVALGVIVELYLSCRKLNLKETIVKEVAVWLIDIYGKFEIDTDDFQPLYQLMTHDKKNEGKRINFTLIPEIGKFEIDINCGREEIFEALDFYRTL
ncbi:3-dehydroquinate synthase [Prolixibacteraceae bacterium JC049]|nr:3-dehydroquinate synthase [Prolixibacteraceae bacterium JC049]